jgi:hypothetical protein
VRRLKLVVSVGVVMAAILALSAGPAMADDFDGHLFDRDFDRDFDDNHFDDGFNETLLLAEGTPAFDQWCSPGLPEGIWIPGCIFSDPIEEDHFFDDAVFVIDDIDFEDIDCDDDHFDCDDDCDCDDDHFGDDDRRFHHDDGDEWRFRDDW